MMNESHAQACLL